MPYISTAGEGQTPNSGNSSVRRIPCLRLFFLTTHSGREKKKLGKSVAQEATSDSASGFGELPTKEILESMARVKDDQVPTSPEEREKYFMLQVEKGERLCAGGAFAHLGL